MSSQDGSIAHRSKDAVVLSEAEPHSLVDENIQSQGMEYIVIDTSGTNALLLFY